MYNFHKSDLINITNRQINLYYHLQISSSLPGHLTTAAGVAGRLSLYYPIRGSIAHVTRYYNRFLFPTSCRLTEIRRIGAPLQFCTEAEAE